MKKITLLLALAFIMSCSKDDVECKCDVKVVVFETPSFDYILTGVPTDCNGNYEQQDDWLPENHVLVGEPFNCR